MVWQSIFIQKPMGPRGSILEQSFVHATFSLGAAIKDILLVGPFILNPFPSFGKTRPFLLSNISPTILKSSVLGKNIQTLDVVAVWYISLTEQNLRAFISRYGKCSLAEKENAFWRVMFVGHFRVVHANPELLEGCL